MAVRVVTIHHQTDISPSRTFPLHISSFYSLFTHGITIHRAFNNSVILCCVSVTTTACRSLSRVLHEPWCSVVWCGCGCGCGVGVVRCAMRDSRCWRGSRSAPRRVAPPMQYVVAVYDIHVVVNHLYFIYHDGYGGGRGNGHGNGSDRIGLVLIHAKKKCVISAARQHLASST